MYVKGNTLPSEVTDISFVNYFLYLKLISLLLVSFHSTFKWDFYFWRQCAHLPYKEVYPSSSGYIKSERTFWSTMLEVYQEKRWQRILLRVSLIHGSVIETKLTNCTLLSIDYSTYSKPLTNLQVEVKSSSL